MSATALNRFDPELRHLHAPLPGIPDESDRPPVAPRPITIRFGREESDMKEAADKISLAVRSPAAASAASNNSVKSTLKGLIEEGILLCLELQKPDCPNREELLRRMAADADAMDREVTAYLDLCKSASPKTPASASSTSTPYYTLVHELRTPLQSLLGLLSFKDQSEAYFLDLHKIYKELDWLADQIPNREEQEAEIVLKHEPFSPEELFQIVNLQLGPYAQKFGVALSFQISPHIPALLIGDKRRIGLVLKNLISNAIKFSPKGGRVTVSFDIDPQLKTPVFSVADQGKGISLKNQKKLFKPFSQVEEETPCCLFPCFSPQKKVPSSGVGLSFCKTMVEAMNPGERDVIGVESREGKGSRFWFAIPYREPPKDAPLQVTPTLQAVGKIAQPGLSILAADDSPSLRTTMKRILENHSNDTTITLVDDGDTALSRYEDSLKASRPYNIVFLDLQMPRMRGSEAAARIHKLAQLTLSETRIALISGDPADEVQNELRTYGLGREICVLTKPTRPRDLIGFINASFPPAD